MFHQWVGKRKSKDIIPLLPESIFKAAKLAKLYEDKYPALPKANTRKMQFTPDINVNNQLGKGITQVQKLLPVNHNVPQLT